MSLDDLQPLPVLDAKLAKLVFAKILGLMIVVRTEQHAAGLASLVIFHLAAAELADAVLLAEFDVIDMLPARRALFLVALELRLVAMGA